ncbi:MAG: thioredoxin fold domain-containing protein [bacterium]|nr:thioredoxin fold domain-containing protein [bacterium]
MDWNIKELNSKNFFRETSKPEYPVFVDFWSTSCPPCRMMDPVIEQLAECFEERIVVRKLNTDFNKSITAKLGISGVPTYILFRKGKEIWREVGALSKKKLINTLEELL